MMLRLSFGLTEEADVIERAVKQVLNAGYRTADIAQHGDFVLSTTEMVEKVKDAILDDVAIERIMQVYV